MKTRLSTHAQVRMMERGIDIDKIKKVINNPDKTSLEFNGRVKVVKNVDGKPITVVYSKDKNVFVIITAIC